ncbi:DUF748 domain-containing protein [Aquipseudomonas campi]|uniref:DUF748 domain-containing protein n=1 Tax=Aquipseudomonas campi TaxID=2731681 RepID=A0A6M8FPN4_9GAMM|nr:DUF748 domain-containing protein [Pseudomonas campi]QKE62728.1 DUF748 domain-containing protein [Pseudomonas campi]
MKRRYSLPLTIVFGLVALVLALHLALPYLIRDYLNDKLAAMGDYRGQIADVDLAWWRGAYRINGLEIVKVAGDVPVPLLDAPSIDLAVSWHALWYDQGVVARALFESPELNFVDGGERPEDTQTGAGVNWRAQLEKLLPITLDEIRVVNGRITFRNFTSQPPVHLQASDVNASLYNLTNVADKHGERVARFEGRALLLDHAPLEATVVFDPFENFDDFELRLRATNIELRKLNDFSSAYGKFDFNAGHGDLVIEATADQGRLSGYVKPLLRDVEVFNWQQDVEEESKGFFRSIWEALVGSGETALRNQPTGQFATRVELSGNVHQQDVSGLQVFLEILRNAFIEAFNNRFENSPPAE